MANNEEHQTVNRDNQLAHVWSSGSAGCNPPLQIITINFNCSVLKFQQLLLSSVPTPHHTSCFSVCTPYLKPFDSSLCATSPGFSYHLGGQVWGLFPVSLFQLLPVLFWRIPPDFNLYVVFVHSLYFNDVSWPVCDWLLEFPAWLSALCVLDSGTVFQVHPVCM